MRRIKYPAAFAETAQRKSPDAQSLLNLRQCADLLQRSHRIDQRIEQIQQDQQDVIIEMKFAVTGLVTIAPGLVNRRQQTGNTPQLLEALQLLDRKLGGIAHTPIMPNAASSRNRKNLKCANAVPNGIG